MSDMIDRDAAVALPPYDSDGDPAGQFDHHIFVKLADIRALPAVEVGVKPGGIVGEGPQNRALKTCKGCKHFHSEYWREPSGDGETWDSGTSAVCLKANATISTYNGSEPSPPSWCPCVALTVTPAPDAGKVKRLVDALHDVVVEYDPSEDGANARTMCEIASAALTEIKETDHD